MTEPADLPEEPDQPAAPARAALPLTGHPAIDRALSELQLGEDVHTHHDEIAAVLDTVQRALNPSAQPRLPRP